MHRVSLSRARSLWASDVEVGYWLVCKRGVSPIKAVGYGTTEEEARENARRLAQVANLPPDQYDGEAYLIVPDEI